MIFGHCSSTQRGLLISHPQAPKKETKMLPRHNFILAKLQGRLSGHEQALARSLCSRKCDQGQEFANIHIHPSACNVRMCYCGSLQ